jgi:outer membrane protein
MRYGYLPLFLTAGAAAQTPMHLTLAEAQRLAVANNPQITIAQLNAQAAAQVPIELHSGLEPNIAGAFSGVGADSGSRLAAGGLNNPVVYNRLGTGLTLSQLVTDFGRTSNLVGSASLHAQAQDQTTIATRASILLAVSRTYFYALRAQSVLKVANETVAARQLVYDQVSALARSNLKSTLDVSFAGVDLSDAQLLLATAKSDVRSADAQLATVIALPAQYQNGGFELAQEPDPGDMPADAAPLVDQAIRDRPELGNLRLEQNAAERYLKAEKELNLPTVSVLAAGGFAPVADPQVNVRYGAAGVNVNIPVFNGHLFRARQNEAELRARAAAQSVNDLTNNVIRDVRVAWLEASAARERMGLTAQYLAQARLSLDLAQRRYDIGLGSIVELSQAQLNVTRAEIADSGALYEYQALRSNLSFQIGELR